MLDHILQVFAHCRQILRSRPRYGQTVSKRPSNSNGALNPLSNRTLVCCVPAPKDRFQFSFLKTDPNKIYRQHKQWGNKKCCKRSKHKSRAKQNKGHAKINWISCDFVNPVSDQNTWISIGHKIRLLLLKHRDGVNNCRQTKNHEN